MPQLVNHVVLHHLVTKQRAGQIRKSAVAYVVFDRRMPFDMRSWRTLSAFATWNTTVKYDEYAQCKKVHSKICDRARGTFVVALLPLAGLPTEFAELRPRGKPSAPAAPAPHRVATAATPDAAARAGSTV